MKTEMLTPDILKPEVVQVDFQSALGDLPKMNDSLVRPKAKQAKFTVHKK